MRMHSSPECPYCLELSLPNLQSCCVPWDSMMRIFMAAPVFMCRLSLLRGLCMPACLPRCFPWASPWFPALPLHHSGRAEAGKRKWPPERGMEPSAAVQVTSCAQPKREEIGWSPPKYSVAKMCILQKGAVGHPTVLRPWCLFPVQLGQEKGTKGQAHTSESSYYCQHTLRKHETVVWTGEARHGHPWSGKRSAHIVLAGITGQQHTGGEAAFGGSQHQGKKQLRKRLGFFYYYFLSRGCFMALLALHKSQVK